MAKDSSGSKTDTIVKVMLVFFISLLSFSVGTFVGKQVSDSDHRRLALESEFKDGRDVASQTDEAKDAKISEKDVDTLADEFVNKEKPTAKEDGDGYKSYAKGEAPEMATAKKEMATPAAPAAGASGDAAEKVANNEAASDGQTTDERKPSSALPAVATSAIGKFTVQVASYLTEDEAKTQAALLKNKGWNAFYIPANVSGKTVYRVSVGLFNNHNSAQSFRKDFIKETGMKGPIIQKIIQ